MSRPVLGVGWDVGGWLGNKQAVAVVEGDGATHEWRGTTTRFSMPLQAECRDTLHDLIRRAWPEASDDCLARYRIVLAIDAPLGLPLGWQRLFIDGTLDDRDLDREINSRFAYRATDRWVATTFEKKPLSSTFDRLGNNASVARWHLLRWASESGLSVAPQRVWDGDSAVAIEVYPALAKDKILVNGKNTRVCSEKIASLVSDNLILGTDEHDAAICAFHALAFGLRGQSDYLPSLTERPSFISEEELRVEGWIYSIPPAWLGSSANAPSQ